MNLRVVLAVAVFSLAGTALGVGREPAPPAPNVDAFLKKWDANQDGRISRHEAKGKLRELFDELDLNHDGYLDKVELQAGLEKHPELIDKLEGRDTPALPSVSPPRPSPAVKPNNPGH